MSSAMTRIGTSIKERRGIITNPYDVPSLASDAFSRALHIVGRCGQQRQVATTAIDALTTNSRWGHLMKHIPLLESLTPEGRSVLCMATAMAMHYLGYSFARPSTIALFTSKRVGFKSPAAFPLAMAFISPTSLLLVLGYGKILERDGPRAALLQTTMFCASVILAAGVSILFLRTRGGPLLPLWAGSSFPVVKLVVGALFIFRESYVQLLTSQYWSFMVSVLNPSQSATWFAPISGLTSILSAVAGLNVSKLVDKLGLEGTLAMTSVALLGSLFFSEKAYSIAEEYGFDPADEHKRREQKQTTNQGLRSNKTAATASSSEEKGKESMVGKAYSLFKRVPTLGALFMEILASQGLSTMLNVCFVTKLSNSITDDGKRAGWTGRFFALINIISCAIQFSILSTLVRRVEPAYVWRAMPTIMMCLSCFNSFQDDPTLFLMSGTLLVMKTMEFTARRVLDEMVYVPLDFESRYVAKEVIGVFGYRFGKSGTSLALSALTSIFGTFSLPQLCRLTTVAAASWFACAFRLSKLIPTRAEAEESYNKIHETQRDSRRKR